MYLRILKKDFKRKKTMNVILFLFIILASTFVASGVNNMITVVNGLDDYFAKAEVPDYWACLSNNAEMQKVESMLQENQYDFSCQELLRVDSAEVRINGQKMGYSDNVMISTCVQRPKVFNSGDEEMKTVKEGEIYLTGKFFNNSDYDVEIGDELEITINGRTKTFTIAGSTKDALFGSSVLGMDRFLISDSDYGYLRTEDAGVYHSICVYTEDTQATEKFNELEMNLVFSANRQMIDRMYLMEVLAAAIMLVVSVCLILISMVILRFVIRFTMSEEFREIGVMKAIGIETRKIRGLYIAKYFAISVAGGIIGLGLSIPFGKLMIRDLSNNMILAEGDNHILNVFCSFAVIAVIVLFCYLCTSKVRQFSPIDALRNGEKGERYSRKGVLSLSKSGISPVPFLALNDILSGLRRFITMIVIFILGMLLVIVPVNSVNTLRSDYLVTWFGMAVCDHVVNEEQLLSASGADREAMEEELEQIREKLSEKDIEAEVFREVMFKMNISHEGKKMSSLALQGIGDITADRYVYLDGTAPQNREEIGISHIVAENIGAGIGDTVEVKNGEERKKYMVTAIYQTMNNGGEGIRFYEEEEIDYRYASGAFGIQVKYTDHPDDGELADRKELLEKICPEGKVSTAGEYLNDMMGGVAGQFQSLKNLILVVVLCINILVTVLMVKSFITKEKGEIAMLKAMGFRNSSLVVWQTLRIGIVLFISVLIGALLGTPLSQAVIGPVFQTMGAYKIEFDIVPFEVYIMYPAIMLGVTVLAAMVTALQVRNISAAETANVE